MFQRLRRYLEGRPSRPALPSAPLAPSSPVGPFRPYFATPDLTPSEEKVADAFSDLYYSKLDEGRGLHTIVLSWMGHELFKCPLDLWIYQELVVRDRPDLIIEVGTYKGGSALFLAQMCDLVGGGEILTIDIDPTHAAIRPRHERITYLLGSSTDPELFEGVKKIAEGKSNVLVILDGDHHCQHVLSELRMYSTLVRPGGFVIVEDTNINGHPSLPDYGPGPWEAVDLFLAENAGFQADRTCERFILTMNPRGYLRRIQ